jgi:hypothetical protein
VEKSLLFGGLHERPPEKNPRGFGKSPHSASKGGEEKCGSGSGSGGNGGFDISQIEPPFQIEKINNSYSPPLSRSGEEAGR